MRQPDSESPEEALQRLKALWHARGIPAHAAQPLQKLGRWLRFSQTNHHILFLVHYLCQAACHCWLHLHSLSFHCSPDTAGEGAFAVVELCRVTGPVVDGGGKVRALLGCAIGKYMRVPSAFQLLQA
jgi:hypothetical protein